MSALEQHAGAATVRASLPALVLIAPICFYQRFISRYTPPSCRYYPCCSSYAITALRTRGAVVGTALTVWRLLRCNPWSEGGVDHVPLTGWPHRERDAPAGSSTSVPHGAWQDPSRPADVGQVESIVDAGIDHTHPVPDCSSDAPPSMAGHPTIGRSAA
ncbi:MAG TPA: membrane protein insertion efficiency factor YidD [Nakamurella sp.]|nr:membrane protein insertion efficiency factor YidD [Nakamurella sp.]